MQQVPDSVIELSSQGYCETSNYLHNYMRRHPDMHGNVFRFAPRSAKNRTKNGNKYSLFDLFGTSEMTYYVLDCADAKKEFSEYLAMLFKLRNYAPDKGIKIAFTHILHEYDLHSELCSGVNCRIVDSFAREFG